MASTRMMKRAREDYDAALAAWRSATPDDAEMLRTNVLRIEEWLQSAVLGCSDRDCEFVSGYAPARRPIRRATRQLVEVRV